LKHSTPLVNQKVLAANPRGRITRGMAPGLGLRICT
jgi:hypothetical protein